MESSPTRDFSPLVVRLAVLWLAAGALFKLFAGTPNDLPPVLRELPIDGGLLLKLAVAAELSITIIALLRPKLAWGAVVAVFVVFEVVLSIGLVAGDASCGCFGANVTISPALMMGIDGVFLLAILASRPWRTTAKPIGTFWLIPVGVILATFLPFWHIGEQVVIVDPETSPEDVIEGLRWVDLDIDSWDGQLIYDTQLATLMPDEVAAFPIDALVVFYRSTCEHCAAHLQEIADNDDGSRFIVLLRIVEEDDSEENRQVRTLPSGGHVIEYNMPEGAPYLLETPAEFELKEGLVANPQEGIEFEEHVEPQATTAPR